MKKLPGKSINAMALPFKEAALHVYNVKFQIDGYPVMIIDMEMLGKRAGGNNSLFRCDRMDLKINGKPLIGHAFTCRGRKP